MLKCSLPLCNARKLALRFFREEQRKNANLEGLSAAQKAKVIMKMFKQLNGRDMESLERRATAWEAKKSGGASVAEPHHRRGEVTPYEVFFKEQLSNPSIASITSPGVRERKLFAIYNSLPERTREAYEQRAREISRSDGAKAFPAYRTPVLLSKEKAPARKKKKVSGKNKKKKTIPKRKEPSGKSAASPYATFVKEQMPHVKHIPPRERMKVIAEKWKASKAPATSEKIAPPEGAAFANGADADVAATSATATSDATPKV
ncbi:hypothetical protein DQ04_16941010 [Trypanosoma grayi]|uniref:hypothetical protein n=1 Tax=Trypanosoma grayi TaxID=71804 RepID=UPI0004F45C21|nr:hypothetical protein DQ04_16941010 [Trypanosoma grayi]KEG05966.1 hypothetical protein DQ04_16941010 [Trypanosoma grayi]